MRAHFRHLGPRSFQWYKERHKTLSFDPFNHSLKFWESTGTPSPKVGIVLGVWGFIPSYSLTLSYTPGSVWCDSRASSCLDSRASSYLTPGLFLALTPMLPLALTPGLPLGSQPCNPFCLGHEPKARVVTGTLNMWHKRAYFYMFNSISTWTSTWSLKDLNISLNLIRLGYLISTPNLTIVWFTQGWEKFTWLCRCESPFNMGARFTFCL
jgi:hypothetical protein